MGGEENSEGGLQPPAFLESPDYAKERFGGSSGLVGESEIGGREYDGRLVVDAVLTSPPYPGVYDISHMLG